MLDQLPEQEEWLSISQAALRLSVHASTLRRWADNGDIPYMVTPGGHRRFATTDIARFAERRLRLRRKPSSVEQAWADSALTVTRKHLATHGDEPWLSQANGGRRERHREIGRQLVGLTMQFIAADEDQVEQFMEEARHIGRQYAQIAREAELSLAEALRASIFFRDMLVETALQLPDGIRIRQQANLRLMRKINALLNTVHLTIAEEYDAADSDILSRD